MSAKSEQAKKASLEVSAKTISTAPAVGAYTLIRDGAVVVNDFTMLSDDDLAPNSGKVIVTLTRWQQKADCLKALVVGVLVPNTADVEVSWPSLKSRPLIVLEFPAFGDGRAYSQARLLREACGYRGEIRAIGAAVVLDQIAGMLHCGINGFQLRRDQSAERCLSVCQKPSVMYQHSYNYPGTVAANRGH